LLPPLTITVDGHQTMVDFGLALALQNVSFTFPFASRLTNGPSNRAVNVPELRRPGPDIPKNRTGKKY